MTFSLLPLSKAALEALAESRIPDGLASRALPGAMPPAFVAARSLALGAAGHVVPWATTFLIVSDADASIVGGCGFKTAPINGTVEVGYAISPAAQGKGAATAALNSLLQRAFAAGATEVLAEVVLLNLASTRVVQKAGFAPVGARMDQDNEYVVQWVKGKDAVQFR